MRPFFSSLIAMKGWPLSRCCCCCRRKKKKKKEPLQQQQPCDGDDGWHQPLFVVAKLVVALVPSRSIQQAPSARCTRQRRNSAEQPMHALPSAAAGEERQQPSGAARDEKKRKEELSG